MQPDRLGNIHGIFIHHKTNGVELVVLDNLAMLQKMTRNQFSGRVDQKTRAELERVLHKHSPRQIVEWNCNCNSVQRMARVILSHEK
jgi:hypothetical protein